MSRSISAIASTLLILFTIPLLAKTETALKSTIRIVDGLTAPNWEFRFLPPRPAVPEPSDPITDADPLSTPPRTVKNRIVPIQRPAISRQKVAPVERTPISSAPTEAERAERTVVTPEPQPPKSAAPRTPARNTQPLSAPAKSKIDKKEETDDDSADKRKKERRDTLREERKERNYRNRRIE
jgi:hypothetical protein